MTGITGYVASTSRPASARAQSPRLRRRRTIPPTFARRAGAALRLVLPPLALGWAIVTPLFAGFTLAVTVMFAVANGDAATAAPAAGPVAAIDDILGLVAQDSAALVPAIGAAFDAVPALIALVHLSAIVLAVSVVVRRRIGLLGRLTAAVVLLVTAISAVRFWADVVRMPAEPGPDVVAWISLFLIPTIAVLILELAVKAPGRAHRRPAEAAEQSPSNTPARMSHVRNRHV